MSQRTGVLAHFQPLDVKPTTHVRRDDADELVRRMICERISRKLIRMLPPQSVFLATRPNRPASYSLPDRLPPVEVENCKFIPPKTAQQERKQVWNWDLEPWPAELVAQ